MQKWSTVMYCTAADLFATFAALKYNARWFLLNIFESMTK